MQESVSIRRMPVTRHPPGSAAVECRPIAGLASKGDPCSRTAAALIGGRVEARQACLFLSSAPDLLYATQPILYLAVDRFGQDVVRAGLAIGGQPVAQLCRILSVPSGA